MPTALTGVLILGLIFGIGFRLGTALGEWIEFNVLSFSIWVQAKTAERRMRRTKGGNRH